MSASTTGSESPTDDDDREHNGATKRRIAPLLARRRRNLDRDGHVACHDYVDDDGRKIRELSRPRRNGGKTTLRIDYTVMLGAAPSTSGNLELLRIEARQAADATPEEIATMNPHVPANDDVLERATEAIESEGLVPAWEVCDR